MTCLRLYISTSVAFTLVRLLAYLQSVTWQGFCRTSFLKRVWDTLD